MRPTRSVKLEAKGASRWREFARYIATVSGIGAGHMSDPQLRKAAKAAVGRAGLSRPASMVLRALGAADRGEPYSPSGQGEA